MSSYFGSVNDIDPATGLPRKKKQRDAINQAWAPFANQIQQSLAANPGAGLAASGIDFGFGTRGQIRLPGAPDYASLINNDPAFMQMKSDLGAQGVSDAAQRAAATQRALVQWGDVPQFDQLTGLQADYLNQDVTPATRELAQKNTEAGLSIKARQDKAFKDQVRQIKNALAARGALRSGEAAYSLQEAQLGRDQATYDTTQAILDFLSGLQAGYAERQRLLRTQEAQGAAEAAGRVQQQYPTTAVPAGGYALPQAPPVPPVDDREQSNYGELPSAFRNGYVDNTGNRAQQMLAQALRRYVAA